MIYLPPSHQELEVRTGIWRWVFTAMSFPLTQSFAWTNKEGDAWTVGCSCYCWGGTLAQQVILLPHSSRVCMERFLQLLQFLFSCAKFYSHYVHLPVNPATTRHTIVLQVPCVLWCTICYTVLDCSSFTWFCESGTFFLVIIVHREMLLACVHTKASEVVLLLSEIKYLVWS